MTSIGPGTRVRLAFTLKLATGEIIDTTGSRPAEFVVADGKLLPGFEKALFGMKAGESATLPIAAAAGFGEHDLDHIQMMPKSAFGPDIRPEPGLVVSFADRQEAELPGVVNRVFGESVEVDFNHPLAGRDLLFEVEIVEVEQVSDEIFRG